MVMSQSALKWLHAQIVANGGVVRIAMIEKAREIEKEQMSGSYTEGFKRAAYIRDLMSQHLDDWNEGIPDDFETYYKKTYGNQ